MVMLKISNKVFEMRMTNYFICKEEDFANSLSEGFILEITRGGRFNMELELCLERFLVHWQLYTKKRCHAVAWLYGAVE